MKKSITYLLIITLLGGAYTANAQNQQHLPQLPQNILKVKEITGKFKSISKPTANLEEMIKAHKNTGSHKSQNLIAIYDSVYYWQWDPLINGWAVVPYGKTINITYDSRNNKTGETYQYWDNSLGTWININQGVYTYDANNNMTIEIYQTWDSNLGNWVNYFQYIYTYDANNNMTDYLSQNWNTSLGNWVNVGKGVYAYDANNNMTSEIYQTWNISFGAWANSSQDIYTYDANNNMTDYLSQNWNTSLGNWVNSSKGVYTYDANNNMTGTIYQTWNTSLGNWVNAGKIVYTYDANNNMTSSLNQTWDSNIGNWANASSQQIYAYDANNNIINELIQIWDNNFSLWVNNGIFGYTYDVNNIMTSESYKNYNGSGGIQISNGDSTHYYFHMVTGSNKLKEITEGLKLYPNPSSNNFLTISTEAFDNAGTVLEIYNTLGELIKSEKLVQNQQQLYVGDLSSGVYMVSVKSNDQNYCQKLIIKH